jgi:DNA replication protein DnaC
VAGSDDHANLLARYVGTTPATAAECNGRGQVTLQTEEGPMLSRCPVCEESRLREAVCRIVPQRFRAVIPVPEAVGAWARRGAEAEGLYLAGPVGTGKTHTAWMAATAWCVAARVRPIGGYWAEEYIGNGWHGPNIIFARMVDLLDDFRPGDDSLRRVRDCQSADLLVIDDLGAEKPSEWTQERLYSVVDHRYANCLPLLVTGNVPPAKLAEQTGDRVASRLAEMCQVVPVTGSDRRYTS